jgi:hypothetical protein
MRFELMGKKVLIHRSFGGGLFLVLILLPVLAFGAAPCPFVTAERGVMKEMMSSATLENCPLVAPAPPPSPEPAQDPEPIVAIIPDGDRVAFALGRPVFAPDAPDIGLVSGPPTSIPLPPNRAQDSELSDL